MLGDGGMVTSDTSRWHGVNILQPFFDFVLPIQFDPSKKLFHCGNFENEKGQSSLVLVDHSPNNCVEETRLNFANCLPMLYV